MRKGQSYVRVAFTGQSLTVEIWATEKFTTSSAYGLVGRYARVRYGDQGAGFGQGGPDVG